MKMISTRGGDSAAPSQAILRGLAADGGLFVPEEFPRFSMEDIRALGGMPYADRACFVLSRFLPDFSEEELREAVTASYGANFDSPAIAPLADCGENTHALELWHGPTSAFKDMALQLLPRLLRRSAEKNGERREIFILVATSGDTGKAALEGFRDVPRTRCCVFYPRDGVSQAQYLQMVTTGGNNTHVIAVRGNFDDAQTGVKRIFSDRAFAGIMDAQGRVLSSANSINYGRLVPQVVYYFSAYADLLARGLIREGEEINFAVPTGNFGDILAADYAKKAGLPVGKLICCSNDNNVLSDFIRTGEYSIKDRLFLRTTSPSMDILISSNLERLLFDLSGCDGGVTAARMASLKEGRRYAITESELSALQARYAGGFATEAEVEEEIRRVWRENEYLLDTHTAVASRVLEKYRADTGDARRTVIVSTASPYKFGAAVLRAAFGAEAAEGLNDFACCDALEKRTGLPMPAAIRALPSLPVRHRAECAPDGMAEAVLAAIK
ncbi:MAG: threonine synthase [Clostridiales bacterium]|nr:threonine synthase [Clostridiales bacterium]